MSDEPLNTDDQQNNPPEWASDPKIAYEEIQRLREENKNRRTEMQKLQSGLDSIMERLAPAEDEEVAADGDSDPISVLTSRLESAEKIIQQFEQRAKDAERMALVTRVAAAHNLPDELAARLRGNTEEELIADAKSLAKFAPQAETESAPPIFGGRFSTTGIPGGQASTGDKENEMRSRLFGRSRDDKPSGSGGGRIRNW